MSNKRKKVEKPALGEYIDNVVICSRRRRGGRGGGEEKEEKSSLQGRKQSERCQQ